MRYSLADLTRRTRTTRRKVIPLRPIQIPAVKASDLYAATYGPVIALWQAALPTILAEYERTLGELTTDAPADASAVIAQVEAQGTALAVALRLRLETWAKRLAAWHAARWSANVKAATGIELGLVGVGDARMTVEAAVERNAALVRNISDTARNRIADAVFRGFQRRAPAREVAVELREAVGVERRRALRVAADQAVKLGAALNEERRREAGISAWAWVSSHKANPRPEHAARDGRLYSDDPADVGREDGGRVVAATPAERPGELIHCGCTERAVLLL